MQAVKDYQRIAQAIRFIQTNADIQPDLYSIADHLGLSAEHCQRLFKRWAGISPKRFLQYLTVEHAKAILKTSGNTFDATFASGLSSGSRLHDHFVKLEAMTPGEYQLSQSRNNKKPPLIIRHGVYVSPFGMVWLAATDKGICQLQFLPDDATLESRSTQAMIDESLRQWPHAQYIRDDNNLKQWVVSIFFDKPDERRTLVLHVKGSNFQMQVWKALLSIPPGKVCSYSQLAGAIGKSSASRAVANAVGANPVAFLIPCHRVIRNTGLLGGYHWGVERKQAILAWESAR